jgi:hypothetical protein
VEKSEPFEIPNRIKTAKLLHQNDSIRDFINSQDFSRAVSFEACGRELPIVDSTPGLPAGKVDIQLPPILRIFEILEKTKKRKGGSTKIGGSWGVRFLYITLHKIFIEIYKWRRLAKS